jgi:hypothetical protein
MARPDRLAGSVFPNAPSGTAVVLLMESLNIWTDAATGEWAVLYRWKKGFVAPRHKHLGAIHAYIVSGRLKLRDVELGPGDYIHEANGMVHDVTEALEDTLQLNVANGPLLFFSDTEITGVAGWEQMRKVAERARPG